MLLILLMVYSRKGFFLRASRNLSLSISDAFVRVCVCVCDGGFVRCSDVYTLLYNTAARMPQRVVAIYSLSLSRQTFTEREASRARVKAHPSLIYVYNHHAGARTLHDANNILVLLPTISMTYTFSGKYLNVSCCFYI